MLRFLKIRHLAVIDAVEVEFEPGLNVLTGETGAGKSILVEAVGLLLGGRASADLVRTGEASAIVDAIFERDGEELLVRREVTTEGRSRAFVNDSLVTVGALRDLSSQLIELHGQHEHQTLLDTTTHLMILDAFGRIGEPLAAVSKTFERYREARVALDAARTAHRERGARQELIGFQLAELDRADLKPSQPNEDTELASLRQVLSSAERIERLCMDSYAALYESDDAVLPRMGSVWRRVSELASLDTQFQPYLEARDAIKSQLEDLAGFLRRYAGGIDASPERLQQAEERLATLERLKRKHGPTLAEVLAKHVALKREALELERSDETVHALEAQLSAARSAYVSAASVLSRERKRVSEAFGHAMERELAELAMDRTRFEVRFGESRDESAWTVDGVDDVEFYISPNPGEDLRPVARIASGGELSRIMLAIKTLVATSRLGYTDSVGRPPSPSAPGLIFDEVDAGIGGRAADVVGRKLRTLGSAFQVLCITHLPQIAAYADTHFQIDKQVRSERAETSVRRLMSDARVEELSRMLGGAVVSDGLRQSAREMLKERSGKTAPSRKVGGESERAKAKGGRRKSRGA